MLREGACLGLRLGALGKSWLIEKIRKNGFVGGCQGGAGRNVGDLRKWNRVEPSGINEIKEDEKWSPDWTPRNKKTKSIYQHSK